MLYLRHPAFFLLFKTRPCLPQFFQVSFTPFDSLTPTMSSTPSEVQKRPRDEDNSTPSNHPPEPLPAITNDKQFWFEDGNVILVARDARFKVYKGLLAAQSPVFGDLFACASHAEETYEGCPVVRLTDAPEDLKCLLGYLLPTTCVR